MIKDNLEYKNFVEYFQLLKNKDYDIYITSPVEIDDNFIKDIYALDPKIKILNIWNNNKVAFLDKVKYWCKRQFFYLENSLKSESCFQKFWIHLGFNEKIVLSGKLRRIQIMITKILLFIFPKHLFSIINNLNYSSAMKIPICNIEFNYIVFMRSDSANNIPFFNSFKTKKNKIITCVRNYDSPSLKGIFTVPSDITLVNSYNLQKILKKLHNIKDIGVVKVIKLKSHFLLPFEHKVNSILYCTSHPKFFPEEPKILKNLIQTIPSKYSIKIRLHPADNIERYSLDKHFFLDSTTQYTTYNLIDSNKIKFHNLSTIQLQKQEFQQFDMLITHSSTIVKDAYDNGITKLYFIYDENDEFKFIFEREHIQILIDELCIKKLNFKGRGFE